MIYEYCIQEVIRKQAEEFYKGFPKILDLDLNQQLKADYVRMEDFRRKDSFLDFCESLYQQIELITSNICKHSELNKIVKRQWSFPAFTKNIYSTKDKDKRYEKGDSIAKLICHSDKPVNLDENKNISELSATNKMYIVTYFIGYGGALCNKDSKAYNELIDLLYYIYIIRCRTHRDTSRQTDNQKNIFDSVMQQQGIFYFKFLGALAQYVELIKNGWDNFTNTIQALNAVAEKPQ